MHAGSQAGRNPDTNKPVGAKRIYDIMTERCHDGDPNRTWAMRTRLSKPEQADEDQTHRYSCAIFVQRQRGRQAAR